jgi:hypothetical protein
LRWRSKRKPTARTALFLGTCPPSSQPPAAPPSINMHEHWQHRCYLFHHCHHRRHGRQTNTRPSALQPRSPSSLVSSRNNVAHRLSLSLGPCCRYVCHELRNPLHILKACASSMLQEIEGSIEGEGEAIVTHRHMTDRDSTLVCLGSFLGGGG